MAPAATRWVFSGASRVNTGLWEARRRRVRWSVPLSGAAWATRTASAREATKEFPCGGEFAGDAALVRRERGEEKQAPPGKGGFPGGWKAHTVDGAGGADDDGLGATEKEVEGFAFHRGVEAADDDAAGVAEGADEVVGLEDEAAGASGGTEEGEFG
jgi:hypothetical protein